MNYFWCLGGTKSAIKPFPVGHGKLNYTIVSEKSCENVKETIFSCMGDRIYCGIILYAFFPFQDFKPLF